MQSCIWPKKKVEVRVLLDAKVETSRLNLTEGDVSRMYIPCQTLTFHVGLHIAFILNYPNVADHDWQKKYGTYCTFFPCMKLSCFYQQWIISMPVVPCQTCWMLGGFAACCQHLLAVEADDTLRTPQEEWTALHLAALKGHVEVSWAG